MHQAKCPHCGSSLDDDGSLAGQEVVCPQCTGIFRQVAARRRKVFDDLRIELDLSPGHTCLLSATDPVKGLGRHFFTYGTEAESPGPKLLLIRLARTQYEDLFGGEQILAPIVSATE